jgi:hypothetical protein
LDENFNQSLQAPPESHLDKLWSGEESCVWLNASDVASYFRSLGMDFDSSLDIVNVERNPKVLQNIWHYTQDLPATGLASLCGDGFMESQQQQTVHDAARLSSTAYQHLTETAQDANEFGGSFMSVDVSKLIHGEPIFPDRPTENLG